MSDNKTILIIEDDEDSRFLLKYYLEDMNFDILEASNGKEGLETAISEIPDLVLIDIMMPVMDGFRATIEMRKNKGTKRIPIIALTANTSDTEKEKCLNAGCTDFIEKPIDLNILSEMIYKYTGIKPQE